MAGVTQIEVNNDIGLDFSSILKSLLRQDPDVILLGEIRDTESAKMAAEAALTGHLVLTTMHTNSAIQAITRLIDIGVEPFLVAPAIIGVMAQRLVRRLCMSCREEVNLDVAAAEGLFIMEPDEEVTVYQSHGCAQCQHSGYSGRMGIHEVLIIDDDIRSMIARDQSIVDIRTSAIKKGFKTMRFDGMKKVLRGMTSLEELNRVTLADMMRVGV